VVRNRQVFEKAMQRAADYAWDRQWGKAISEYMKALTEFPDDVMALTGIGLALLETRQLDKALSVYQRAARLAPGDPVILGRMADVLDQMGRKNETAEAYMMVAEAYLRQRAVERAVECWQRVVRLCPGHLQAHQSLAKACAGCNQTEQAIREFIILASLYQRQGQIEQAIQQCQSALQLDARNAEVQRALRDLQHDQPIQVQLDLGAIAEKRASLFEKETATPAVEEKEGSINPADQARQRALSELAEAFFEEVEEEEETPTAELSDFTRGGKRAVAVPEMTKAQLDAFIGQAIDHQMHGRVEDAIDAYRRAVEGGVSTPAAHFNLGLLYQEKMRFDEATVHLEEAVHDPDYALGARFALGQCYRAQGKIDDALSHFIEVLKIVDLQTVQRDQVDDLIQVYESLTGGFVAKGSPQEAERFANSLVEFLSSKGWEDKVIEARRRLDSVTEEGMTMSLVEMFGVPGSEEVLGAMSITQEYLKRDMLFTAMEECFWAIQRSPFYLPLHMRLAEILLRQNRFEEAAAKYLTVAEVYQARGDFQQAIRVYKKILRLTPMDVNVRARLIDLLVSHGQIDLALEHYMFLADAYYQLAQVNKALEKYNEALHLAPRGSPEREWQVPVLHRIGDIEMQRLNWRQAIRVYDQIKRISPQDEKARIYLVDLYFKLKERKQALAEMDELIALYQEQGKPEKVLAALENAIALRPDELSLQQRLAQAHIQQGNKTEAIAVLDALGKKQLEAGLKSQAMQTIQAIISMKPPNPEAYRKLLARISA
jgi:tetratricopeptide (TPR) repeat protein